MAPLSDAERTLQEGGYLHPGERLRDFAYAADRSRVYHVLQELATMLDEFRAMNQAAGAEIKALREKLKQHEEDLK